ncbi:MAG: hypothetical protein ACFFDN_49300 [Candidatus Hodarchaeota archaeon]
MIDFWVAVILTIIVSLLTILADWLASRIIISAKTLRSLQEILNAGLTAKDLHERIKNEINKYRSSQVGALAWGADLATVAISMDFAALGIWIHNPTMFPFFSRFNSLNVSREIPIWLIVIGLHIILLIISLVLKHKYGDISGTITEFPALKIYSKEWITQNGWMVAANFTGFFSLLTSITVFTNAL